MKTYQVAVWLPDTVLTATNFYFLLAEVPPDHLFVIQASDVWAAREIARCRCNEYRILVGAMHARND